MLFLTKGPRLAYNRLRIQTAAITDYLELQSRRTRSPPPQESYPMIGHWSCPSECRRRNRCHGMPNRDKTRLESHSLVLEQYCLMISRMHYLSLLSHTLYTIRHNFINPLQEKLVCCNSPATIEKHRIKYNTIKI